MIEERPYTVKRVIVETFHYNPRYGNDRLCVCGHPYYRHFDTYDDMEDVGCKYCGCFEFKEETCKNQTPSKDSSSEI